VLIGLIAAPDLEYALDKLESDEDQTLCLIANINHVATKHKTWWIGQVDEEHEEGEMHHGDTNISHNSNQQSEHADLTPFVDPAPMALDVHSPMDLVYQCFVKLGLRYICVVEGGEYRGMVHKKVFVRYVKEDGTLSH
jgi:chloride channel 3/4/5